MFHQATERETILSSAGSQRHFSRHAPPGVL